MLRSSLASLASLAATLCSLAALLAPGSAGQARAAQTPLEIPVVYLTQVEQRPVPLSLLDPILTDEGLLGARAGLKDNETTGRFLGQNYSLAEVIVPLDGDPAAAFREQLALGRRIFLVDLPGDQLLALADLPGAGEALLFNNRAQDDALRQGDCRANILHVMHSRAMKADALAQYLVWKKWRAWFLVHGKEPGDLAFAAALRRAARKFGAKIVEERAFEEAASGSRTDSGHVQVQKQMPVFTQDAAEHDVLLVADESDLFGEYLPYRAWDARPVAGTQGLIAAAWHRSHEQWGGTQMQRRFEKVGARWMTERDYTNWLAQRAIGEAVTRIGTADPQALKDYLLGDAFKVPAFKGVGLTFRPWNQQLRQPILLAAPRSLVSVSPQPGFLHQRTPLDSLGFDEPESSCRLG